MFCQKCWHEIPGESEMCTYCGEKIPLEERDMDWEKAALLRELAEEKLTEQPSELRASPAKRKNRCVVPGAKRKICQTCGKSLPASNIGDYCAICTIRMEQKEDASKVYERIPLPPIPISSSYNTLEKQMEGKRSNKIGIFLAVVFSFIAFFVVFGFFLSNQLYGSWNSMVVGTPEVAYHAETSEYDEDYETVESAIVSINDAVTWDSYDWIPLNPETDLPEEITFSLESVLQENLAYLSNPKELLEVESDTVQWYQDGIYLRIIGDVFCQDYSKELYTQKFDIVLYAIEASDGLALLRSAFGAGDDGTWETLYDNLYLITPEGSLTKEGAEYFQVDEDIDLDILFM